jgi:hypothetical protein
MTSGGRHLPYLQPSPTHRFLRRHDLEVNMNMLVAALWSQRPEHSQIDRAAAEDRYYELYDPGERRLPPPVVPVIAVVGILALILDVAAR